MTRIHPVFTPDIKGKTGYQAAKLVVDAYAEGIEYWTNVFMDEIEYASAKDLPIIIIALRTASDRITKDFHAAGVAADLFEEHTRHR